MFWKSNWFILSHMSYIRSYLKICQFKESFEKNEMTPTSTVEVVNLFLLFVCLQLHDNDHNISDLSISFWQHVRERWEKLSRERLKDTHNWNQGYISSLLNEAY